MQHEPKQVQFFDAAEVLRGAQLQRTEDLEKWFREFFQRRRQKRLTDLPGISNKIATA
jgi:hypothetical protein